MIVRHHALDVYADDELISSTLLYCLTFLPLLRTTSSPKKAISSLVASSPVDPWARTGTARNTRIQQMAGVPRMRLRTLD